MISILVCYKMCQYQIVSKSHLKYCMHFQLIVIYKIIAQHNLFRFGGNYCIYLFSN